MKNGSIHTLALTVVLALWISAAATVAVQAADFTASGVGGGNTGTISATPDGSVGSKPAHHVIFVPKAGSSITCNQVTLDASIGSGVVPSITTSSVVYDACTFLGQPATFNMNGCNYRFNISGTVDILPVGCGPMFFEANGCKVSIAGQLNLEHATYAQVADEVTFRMTLGKIAATTSGKCEENGPDEVSYTTGNFFATSEIGGKMAGLFIDT